MEVGRFEFMASVELSLAAGGESAVRQALNTRKNDVAAWYKGRDGGAWAWLTTSSPGRRR